MVRQIEKELLEEQKQTLARRQEERNRLRDILIENEKNKRRQAEEEERQRLRDIEA